MATNYTSETKISMSLDIGFAGCDHADTQTVEELTGIDADTIAEMSDEDVEKEIDEAVTGWANEYISYGWDKEE